jgi:uncharacterized membrane protein (UPF0127 family)
MKKKKIGLNYKGNKINLEVNNLNFFERGRGLTFRKKEKAPLLLFDLVGKYKDCLTSYFVFFDFLAIWLDEKNNVLDVKLVKPWTVCVNSKTKWSKILEVPINKKYRREIKFFRR